MTFISKELEKCIVCGTESRHLVLLSSNTFGGEDLDGRPPNMLRRTMKRWVQRCRRCGYCATNLEHDHEYVLPVAPAVREDNRWIWLAPEPPTDSRSHSSTERRDFLQSVVQGEQYRAQLHDRRFPKLANSFLCGSLIDEAGGRYVEATFGAMYAAWACDDAPKFKGARECRARAVELIQKASGRSQAFGIGLQSREALLVDALRRTGNFDSAFATCQEALGDASDEFLRNILQFQLELINRRYTAAYSVGDAIRWSPKAWGLEQSIQPRAPRKRWWFWHWLDRLTSPFTSLL